MNLNSLLKLIDGKTIKTTDIIFSSFKIDSRKVTKGDTFICLNNGHNYINEAIENGAVAIIYDKNISETEEIIYIKVNSTIDSLIKIATYKRNNSRALVIAITGSVGKTTTKELASKVLKTKYQVLKNEGNKNNVIGLSETLLNITETTDYIVVEIGMNHNGEISRLSKILKPDIAIITNIGSSHIGNLGSRKNIFKAKMEIIDGNKDTILIVNGEDKYLRKTKSIKCFNNTYPYKNKIAFINMNYLLTILLCERLGFKYDFIIKILDEYKMYKQRMNIIKLNNKTLIDDTYNSSYESVIGGLNYLNNYNDHKKIILGDILELGHFSKKYHKKINKYLKKIKNKEVLLIGNYTKYIKGKHFSNHDELINYLNGISLLDSIIYLKGSRLMKLEIIRDMLVAKS